MPELPEVETTIRQLQNKVLRRTFVDVWTDTKKLIRIRKPSKGQVCTLRAFEEFKKEIKNKKIQKIWRAGKNIIFELSDNLSLLVHQKLTGHLLIGYWILDNGFWKPKNKGPLQEKINSYIHLLFKFDNGKMMALSDLRKFAKVELWETKSLKSSRELKSLGSDALNPSFTLNFFKERIRNKKGKIKQVLMDQNVIAGIGNIYSDEVLFAAKVNPFKSTEKLTPQELERIYKNMRKILKRAIELQGTSISDYRIPSGEKGKFGEIRKVYRREGEKCVSCDAIIKRVKIGSRSAHFCPACQK